MAAPVQLIFMYWLALDPTVFVNSMEYAEPDVGVAVENVGAEADTVTALPIVSAVLFS